MERGVFEEKAENGGQRLHRLTVMRAAGNRPHGLIVAGGLWAPCALGRSSVTLRKREGDGATPAGMHELVLVYFRSDRVRRPRTLLPTIPIDPYLGWCDDPCDRSYNRPVRLPHRASHEMMWREDHLYDVVVVLDYNLATPQPNVGSAIFLHLAAPGFAPTAGCVAVSLETMRRVLLRAAPGTELFIR
jgi:L,D-peptidoglycan transpeptidase YkuD (ErfK/YbiS/YcfS/YnhG family)